jgi:hypothetical protein
MGGLDSTLAGIFRAYLGPDDPAAVNNLPRLGAHRAITAPLAAAGNATRI